jgi:hypothetical protein
MTRCSHNNCKRKLPLTAYTCRCKLLFCDIHKYPEEHKCQYNYYENNRNILEKQLSSITFTKKETLFETI